MKRPSYRHAVQWIADNDEPEDTDVDEISGYVSTLLAADLFEVDPIKVATDIKRYRIKRDGQAKNDE